VRHPRLRKDATLITTLGGIDVDIGSGANIGRVVGASAAHVVVGLVSRFVTLLRLFIELNLIRVQDPLAVRTVWLIAAQRLQKQVPLCEHSRNLGVLPVGIDQDLLPKDHLVVIVDDVPSHVNQVAQTVDQATIKIILVIMPRVLSHIAIEPTFDPADVELCKLEYLRRLLVHNLPKVEHDFAFTFGAIFDDIASVVDQVARGIDEPALHIDCLARDWVSVQNYLLRFVVFQKLADDVSNFELLGLVRVKWLQATIWPGLLFDETDAALIIDDILSFVNQVALPVDRPEELVGEAAEFVSEKSHSAFLVVFKAAHDPVRVEVVLLDAIRHW